MLRGVDSGGGGGSGGLVQVGSFGIGGFGIGDGLGSADRWSGLSVVARGFGEPIDAGTQSGEAAGGLERLGTRMDGGEGGGCESGFGEAFIEGE